VYQFVNPGEGIAKTYISSSATPNNFKTPAPQRTYDALELTVTRRFSHHFSGQASYVWSKLYGNYTGLANTDEIVTPTSNVSSATSQQSGGSVARPGTTASRAYDLDETLFDSHGNFLYGRLPTDRPHAFKLYGNYTQEWGRFGATDIGGFFTVKSGVPVSTAVETVNDIQVFVNGRGDLGRTPVFNQTDLVIAQEFKLSESKRLRFEFNAINLFNQKTALHIFNQVNRGANTSGTAAAARVNLSSVNFFNGFDYKAMLNSLGPAVTVYDPRFGMGDFFNPGFQGRIGVKFIF
jgi:hypothetical protein